MFFVICEVIFVLFEGMFFVVVNFSLIFVGFVYFYMVVYVVSKGGV